MEDLRLGKATIPVGGSTAFASSDFFVLFRQKVLEGASGSPGRYPGRDFQAAGGRDVR
jgi:hypothetical protein